MINLRLNSEIKMDEPKLYINKTGNFSIVATEGNALPLTKGIQEYEISGKYKKEIDFSPIVQGRSIDEDFMVANIYGNGFCTMTCLQHHSKKPNTSLVCSGNKELPLEFLVEFAKIIELKNLSASIELIEEAKNSQNLLSRLYEKAKQKGGEDFAAELISAALKIQQQTYISDARTESARNN